ncbi:RHS repeat-associated core domain-containing protein, partial [Chryseobacterium sp. NRRL B-14859]|uniref:RHS repeat-associated core domain-containing protein n=1 Tax=Chryseobacterium sp. NRRL B-14859 TaxID=1562763 RepID=UPI003393935D
RNAKNTTNGLAMQIDNLSYTYTGNRLLKVTDASQNYLGYSGGGNTIEYDTNGNMTSHMDKGIALIKYNYLNLPNFIIYSNIGIGYTYRADGVKVKKLYGSIETNYLEGFQYDNSETGQALAPTLKFVPTAEGYFDYVKNKYIYNYTDHLGNIRLSYFNNGSSIEVLEENNYYPFGLKHEGINVLTGNPAYQYKYNGKELQETGMYDYGARFYMPDIGRWGVVDPLAETSRRWSPYTYAYNNPIRFIDPDGRQNEDIIKVNMQGYVQEVIPQEGPHIVQDTDGNQLNFNDYGNDQEQLQAVIDVANTMSPIDLQYDGLRLFTPYSAQQMVDDFNSMGIGSIKDKAEYRKSILGTGSLSYFTYGAGLGHGEFDFAGEMGSLVRNGNNYPKLQGPTDAPVDGTGGFVRFEGSNTLYNVYDAGNFMTGKAFQMTGYSLDVIKTGADISSRVSLNGPDTATDQKAITAGYNYNRVGWKK